MSLWFYKKAALLQYYFSPDDSSSIQQQNKGVKRKVYAQDEIFKPSVSSVKHLSCSYECIYTTVTKSYIVNEYGKTGIKLSMF